MVRGYRHYSIDIDDDKIAKNKKKYFTDIEFWLLPYGFDF